MPRGIPNNQVQPTEQVSKMEAMRQAIKELGYDSRTVQYQKFVQKHYGHKMDSNMISTYKSSIKRGDAKKSALIATAAASPAAPVASPVTSVAEPAAPAGGFSLEEIGAVKELAERIGADRVRQLVDVLGK